MLLRRLGWLLRRQSHEADLAEEMGFHREQKQRELEARGLGAAEAAAAADRAMGNATWMREEARAVWIRPWLESVWQDLAYAARSLRRQPVFTLVAVLTLASAIGLNTSLFTVFNAMMLRRWEVGDSGRMVNVFSPYCCRREGGAPNGLSIAEVRYFAEHAHTISGFILTRQNGEGDLPDEAGTSWVSGNYFSVLGVGMTLGRGFAPDEDVIGSPQPVAVLSWPYWRSLGGDARLVGRTITLEGVAFTVVGVAPRGFTGTGTEQPDAWIPLASVQLLRPDDAWMQHVLRQPEHCCTLVAGRLAPNATLEDAEAELSALRRQYQPPGAAPDQKRIVLAEFTALGSSPPRKKGPEVPTFLLMLSGVVAVLVLACANVGNLLLARSAARQREIAVRMSLGASRRRVIRQLLTESLVLAVLAGAVGIAVALRLPSAMVHAVLPSLSALQLTPDSRVLLFTLGLSVVSCFLFGLAPAFHATRPPSAAAVRLPLRTAFLSVQVALCMVLLVAAALLVRGVERVGRRDLGFAFRDLSTMSLLVPAKALDGARTRAFVAALSRAVDGMGRPGSVALGAHEPLHNSSHATLRLPGETDDRSIEREEVSPGYFAVLGVPLLAGRDLEASDAASGAIVVNEALARESGGVPAAVGRTITVDGTPRTIVGVARDANVMDVDDVYPTAYPLLSGREVPVVLVRRDAAGVLEQVAATVARLDSRIRVRVTPVAEQFDSRTAGSRFAAALAGGLGALALLLASVGMFGVFSYWVQQRTQEIGVRMALGARPGQVFALVFGVSARAVVAGLVLGLAGAAAASRLLRSMLYGLSPLDPVAFAAATFVLLVAGAAAVYGPARRATRVDPMLALRAE